MITLYYTLFAIIMICFIVLMYIMLVILNNHTKVLKDIRDLNLEIARLRYANSALVKEIDYHLHGKSNELAVSYFSNCKEVREFFDKETRDSYMIWGAR